MRMTKEIQEAMAAAIDEVGSQLLFAKTTGLTVQNVCKYVNGKVKFIRMANWKKLYPHIAGWMPQKPGGSRLLLIVYFTQSCMGNLVWRTSEPMTEDEFAKILHIIAKINKIPPEEKVIILNIIELKQLQKKEGF